MLEFDELNRIAILKRLSIKNAEKDYLQDLVLFSIYSRIGKELVFKGGTSLYKIYKLDRFSEDLDFTLDDGIDIKKMADKIVSDLILLNIKGRVKEISEYGNEINVRLLLNGPLYKGSKETQCFIPLNISRRERTIIESLREKVFSFYKEIPSFEVFVMAEKEILAEKIRAIYMRIKPRDIYDLNFLLGRGVSLDLNLINRKLAIHAKKFDRKEFEGRIGKMKGLWNTDLKPLVTGEIRKFDDIKKQIKQKLDLLLSR